MADQRSLSLIGQRTENVGGLARRGFIAEILQVADHLGKGQRPDTEGFLGDALDRVQFHLLHLAVSQHNAEQQQQFCRLRRIVHHAFHAVVHVEQFAQFRNDGVEHGPLHFA